MLGNSRSRARNYAWPEVWRLDQPQATGSYPFFKAQYGLRAVDWDKHGYEAKIWRPLATVLAKGQHAAISHPLATLHNIREACKGYYGFLANVLGLSHHGACRLENLLSPRMLHAFWEFQATPRELMGRGLCRSTMRTMCNSMSHMMSACQALGVQSKEHCQCTPEECRKWWKEGGQKKAALCQEGEKKLRARGHALLWEEVQDVVKTSMEETLEQADQLEEQMLQLREIEDEESMKEKLLGLQTCLLAAGPCWHHTASFEAQLQPNLEAARLFLPEGELPHEAHLQESLPWQSAGGRGEGPCYKDHGVLHCVEALQEW